MQHAETQTTKQTETASSTTPASALVREISYDDNWWSGGDGAAGGGTGGPAFSSDDLSDDVVPWPRADRALSCATPSAGSRRDADYDCPCCWCWNCGELCRQLDLTPRELESLIFNLLSAEVKRRDDSRAAMDGGYGTWG